MEDLKVTFKEENLDEKEIENQSETEDEIGGPKIMSKFLQEASRRSRQAGHGIAIVRQVHIRDGLQPFMPSSLSQSSPTYYTADSSQSALNTGPLASIANATKTLLETLPPKNLSKLASKSRTRRMYARSMIELVADELHMYDAIPATVSPTVFLYTLKRSLKFVVKNIIQFCQVTIKDDIQNSKDPNALELDLNDRYVHQFNAVYYFMKVIKSAESNGVFNRPNEEAYAILSHLKSTLVFYVEAISNRVNNSTHKFKDFIRKASTKEIYDAIGIASRTVLTLLEVFVNVLRAGRKVLDEEDDAEPEPKEITKARKELSLPVTKTTVGAADATDEDEYDIEPDSPDEE